MRFLLAAVMVVSLNAALFAQAARPHRLPAVSDTLPEPVLVPQRTTKAMVYYRSGVVLWVVNTVCVWGLIPALVFFTGLSARIRDVARRIGRRRFFVIAVYFVLFSLLAFFIDLPLAYYQDFVREHAYGLSNQTLGKWFGDQVKTLLVGMAALNAYVTGLGGAKRIVLWDTISTRLREPERMFVLGHEMGHYVLGHVWKTILFLSGLILAALYAIHRTAGWLIRRYHERFGFGQLSDIASLPLLVLLFGAYLFVVSPVALAYSRHNEHEADRFGLEITRDNHAAATAFVKWQVEDLSNPRPGLLMKWRRASHPPLGERIDFSNTYRPWEYQVPLVYGHLFRGE